MCKIKETSVGIKRLDFSEHRGKLCAVLTDGRVILVPISFFPDIQKLSVKEREDWMILDDQFFTFHNLSKVYAVTDLMRLWSAVEHEKKKGKDNISKIIEQTNIIKR